MPGHYIASIAETRHTWLDAHLILGLPIVRTILGLRALRLNPTFAQTTLEMSMFAHNIAINMYHTYSIVSPLFAP